MRSRPAKSVPERVHLLAHGAGVADDAARPFEHALAFGGKALETGAAVDQQHAEGLLELLHPGRQGRLGHPAGFGRPAEMLLAGQGEEEFQFFEQGIARSVRI